MTYIYPIAHLADLAIYPGTHDKDRYARSVRSAIRSLLEATAETMPAGPRMVLEGCLRLTSRTEPVETTQTRLRVALDILTTLTGQRWRGEQTFKVDGEWVTRTAGQFSNPVDAANILSRGIITGFDPIACTCHTSPTTVCFAAVHEV